MIRTEQNKLFNGNQLIFTFEEEIEDAIYVNDKAIVCVNSNKSNKNVFCLNLKGEIEWTIEALDYPNEECPVTGITLKGDTLFVYRWCGIEDEININDGSVISSDFVK